MKREVERRRTLPAFRITLDDLGGLIDRIFSLLEVSGSDDKQHCSITINLPNEQLTFSSVDEIRQYANLPDRILSFAIWVSAAGRTLSLRPSGVLNARPRIAAFGDDEGWCAGAVEVIYQFIQPLRLWYSWFRDWPLGAMFLLTLNTPVLLLLLQLKPVITTKQFLFPWVPVSVIFLSLFMGRERFFPAAVLELRSRETFLRKHMSELTLLLAVLTLVLTIIGWFVR